MNNIVTKKILYTAGIIVVVFCVALILAVYGNHTRTTWRPPTSEDLAQLNQLNSSLTGSTPTETASTTSNTMTLTREDNGKTVMLHVGDRLVLSLGNLVWNVTLSPEGFINRVRNIATIQGVQGIYTADKVGNVTLSAIGKPDCAPDQMCAQYLIEYKVTIVVRP